MGACRELASDISIEEDIEIDAADRSQTRVKVRYERTTRWPVLLCGFVAGVAGGIALMQSPVGADPVVQHAVKTTRVHLATAWIATVQFVARLDSLE